MRPSPQCVRQGWVHKKPTSQESRPWRSASIQSRYVESRGLSVAYYVDAPSSRPSTAKARATFDLRDVTVLRPTADKTAPTSAIDVKVGKHNLTIDFQVAEERDGWLRIWTNGVPEGAVPEAFRAIYADRGVTSEMTRLGRKASLPRGLPIPESGLVVSRCGWLDVIRDTHLAEGGQSQKVGRGSLGIGRASAAAGAVVPIYVQVDGYLLHWFPKKPTAAR